MHILECVVLGLKTTKLVILHSRHTYAVTSYLQTKTFKQQQDHIMYTYTNS